MGWWKVRGGDDIVGDKPLDLLGSAFDEVVAQYESALGRRPTKAEWARLFAMVLGNDDPAWRVLREPGQVVVEIRVIEAADGAR